MNEQKSHAAVVMVAEDDDDNRFVLKKLLEMRGYTVVEAANGQEVIDLTPCAHPDLILMDLRMPVLNGLATTRRLRRHAQARVRRVPIVALSAYDAAYQRDVAIEAGCDEYVSKPVDYDRLENLIDALLRRRARAGGGRMQPATLSSV